MELKQMRYYTVIVEEGTFQAAARKLHMTQPPLSAQIRQLEEEIGAPLLIRGARHVQMTETGDFFYRRAKNMLQLADATEKELRDRRTGKSGTIRLGVISSASGSLLRRFVIPFSARYPDVHFELTEANTYELLDRLNSDLLDLALVRTPFTQNPSYQIRELDTESLCAVGLRKNRAGGTSPVTVPSPGGNGGTRDDEIPLEDLRALPLIIYRRWKHLLDASFSETGDIPHYYCVADDARTCISWAEAGLGYAIVPLSAASLIEESAAPCDADCGGRGQVQSCGPARTCGSVRTCGPAESLGIRTIINPVIRSTICAVTSKTAYRSSALELFLDNAELQADNAGAFPEVISSQDVKRNETG